MSEDRQSRHQAVASAAYAQRLEETSLMFRNRLLEQARQLREAASEGGHVNHRVLALAEELERLAREEA